MTLNQKKTWEELEYELGLVEPALILNDGIDYGCRAELEAAYGPKLRPMDCYQDSAPGELTNCVGHDDLMMLMFTSGTTGRSKGVMLSERNYFTACRAHLFGGGRELDHQQASRQAKLPLSHMTLLPLFHMACFVCVMSYPPAGWALNLCGDIRDFYRDLGLMHSDVMASAPMLVETIYNDMKRGRQPSERPVGPVLLFRCPRPQDAAGAGPERLRRQPVLRYDRDLRRRHPELYAG